MSTSIETRAPARAPSPPRATTASNAVDQVSRVGLLLGGFGAAAFVPVFVRLFESWRVSPAVSRRVSVFGLGLSYPAANAGAVIVLALAVLGAAVLGIALVALGRELAGARRLAKGLAGLDPVARDGVLVIEDDVAQAFCAGLWAPRVYITTGALALLTPGGLEAVLEHERHHARRRDPLRAAVARVIEQSLFFLPALGELRRGQQMLAELSADESAVAAAAGDRSGLAAAMLSFGEDTGMDPARIDHLLGEPPAWRFPALMCGAAILVLALLVTVAILVGREAAGSASLAAPFLSAQPCVLMLALIPGALGIGAAGMRRVWLARAR
jgi:hypothetical protein